MKPHMLLCLAPALCLGCLGVPKSAPKAATPAVTAHKPLAPPPVLPDQINDKNARRKLAALQEELDRATQDANDKRTETTKLTKAK